MTIPSNQHEPQNRKERRRIGLTPDASIAVLSVNNHYPDGNNYNMKDYVKNAEEI